MVKNYPEINMILSDVVTGSDGMVEIVSGKNEALICSVEYDSRKVTKGSLFVAVEGLKSDGHRFIEKSVQNGASAVVVSESRKSEYSFLKDQGVTLLAASDTRKALSRLSAVFFGFPSRYMDIIGITGTNGKTSISYMLESVMEKAHVRAGVMGTVNYRWCGTSVPAPNTTPESKDLQELLYLMRNDGVKTVIIEISSHALELNRADDIELNVAVFTNLTVDHLDFHGDFENYFSAKKKIFSLLEKSPKLIRFGIINTDDEYGKRIFEESENYSYSMKNFGIAPGSEYGPVSGSIVNSISGISYLLQSPVNGHEVKLRVPGRFQVFNSLAALASAHALGIGLDTVSKGLSDLETVPGRFDVVDSGMDFHVIVDYAHTSDALLKLLQSVNELKHSRIITVFGCGGDRDKSKRPLMGMAAEENSDLIIVTSDNPRTESPEFIIEDIVNSLKRDNHEVVPDREEAIGRAVSMAEKGDIIVIAGKGHEDYQIIGTEKIHFDDREVAAGYILSRSGK